MSASELRRNAAQFATPRSRIFRAVCHFAGAHPDIAEQSSSYDQAIIVSQAVALILATLLAWVAWTAFFATFLPLAIAAPLGLLIAGFVLVLDRAIVSSDWSLAGVLSEGWPPAKWWLKVGFRIAWATVLAQATAAGAVLWMFSGAIQERLQRDRSMANAPLVEEYEERRLAERRRLLEPAQAELAALQRERDALMLTNQQAAEMRNESRAQVRTAANEAGRELDGYGGRAAGAGPRWREARRAEEAASQLAREAERELTENRTRLAALTPLIEAKTGELREVSERQTQREEALAAQMQRDPRWVREQRDPLSAWIGLAKLKADPDYGATATNFNWLMMTVLLALELGVLAVKMFFAPASVYTVRLIARTKREAVEATTAEADATRDAILRHRPRGRLQVVNGEQSLRRDVDNAQPGDQR